MECIAVINQKGGVGKTASATNLGVALARRGDRVLLIDMDPQGHLTTHLGLDAVAEGAGVYEVLTRNLAVESALHSQGANLSIIPAQIDLAAAEVELVSVVGRELILRDALAPLASQFDFAIIDCPPSLGVLTLNSLSTATRVIVPLQPHFLALQGVGKLLETVALVSARINPRLSVLGMLICMYEAGTRLGGEVIKDLESFLAESRETASVWNEARIFATRIRRNVKLAEAPSFGQSIFDYAPKSNGAEDYLALADEVRALLGRVETNGAEQVISLEGVRAKRRSGASQPDEAPPPEPAVQPPLAATA
ncbi:MAG TPA: AAA family ATPase [Phycisphaerae bacterium]|nr:AAA family ATPase [Phycisphaerae bacterium]